MSFTTEQGRTGTSVIELAQANQFFSTSGTGMSAMTHDPARGFLYVVSKLDAFVYVVDVRDDSGGTLDDSNYLDLETLAVTPSSGTTGYRGALLDPARDRLYLTSRSPEGVVILDLTQLVDNDAKEVSWYTAMGVLAMQSEITNDRGVDSTSRIGGAGMTLSADGRYLLATHHRSNAVAAFDLEQGAWGEEIAWLAHIGENPHVVRLTPDGRHAVVANYVGDVDPDGRATSATLAVIDMDPESETFLEVVTWLVNR